MSFPARLERAVTMPRWLPAPADAAWLPAAAAAATRAFLVLLVFTLAGATGLTLYAASHQGTIYQGVSIGGVPVGGMTPDEAERAVAAATTAFAATPLTLAAGTQTFSLTPADAGLRYDPAASVAAAMRFGRTGSVWQQSQAWARGLLRHENLPAVVTLDPATARTAFAAGVAPALVRAPVDATVNMDAASEPELVPDRDGVAIDYGATFSALTRQAAALDPAPVPVVTVVEHAAVSAAALRPTLGDARAAVAGALRVRAEGATWTLSEVALKGIVAVDPATAKMRIDQPALTAFARQIAGQVDRDARDAAVKVDDNGRLVAVPGSQQVTVDVPASAKAMAAALATGVREVDLVVDRQPPTITDAMAQRAAALAEQWVSTSVGVAYPGGSATLDRSDLLRALTITAKPGSAEPFVLGLDPGLVKQSLQAIADSYDQPARDAEFRIVNGQIAVVADAQEGRSLDVDDGVAAVLAQFGKPSPQVTLKGQTTEPDWSAADLAKIDLGDDILGDAGTYYGDSSTPRRTNVERAALLESGWLVPPGGIFSYADHIRPVDETNGFVTGWGIVEQGNGFTTAPVVGGGICQVSTTIFQAAFWAGLPIVERVQHPYYMRLYGEAVRGLPGLDAMVNIEDDWTLDLKFKNTTGHWIAVVAVADGNNVWSRIVGTNPGWQVSVDTPQITNQVNPPETMTYQDSPELPTGTELQVEHAYQGFDVTINRTVTDSSGQVVDTYQLHSSFAPSYNLTLRGTGTGA